MPGRVGICLVVARMIVLIGGKLLIILLRILEKRAGSAGQGTRT